MLKQSLSKLLVLTKHYLKLEEEYATMNVEYVQMYGT